MRLPRVVDASSTLAWLSREAPDPVALHPKMGGSAPAVPTPGRLEVTHALLKRLRTPKRTPARVRELASLLGALPAEVSPDALDPGPGRLIDVAKAHRLGSCDAVSLDAAPRHRLPLLTHDADLRLGAEAEGVELP